MNSFETQKNTFSRLFGRENLKMWEKFGAKIKKKLLSNVDFVMRQKLPLFPIVHRPKMKKEDSTHFEIELHAA